MMLGLAVFLLWAALLTCSVLTHGVISIAFFIAMIAVAGYGGHLLARWGLKR